MKTKQTTFMAIALITLALFAMTACKEPETPITKNITVPALPFSWGPTIDFTQTLTGWNSDFPSSDVTYKLTFNNATLPDNTTSISATGRPNGYFVLTQTFYYKGTSITNGSRSVVVEVDTNTFAAIYDHIPPPNDEIGSFPELTLHLKK